MATEILVVDEIIQSQAQKEVTHNEGLRQIEGKIVRALSKTTTAEPTSPANGDVYIVPAGATGTNWTGQDGNIAHFYGGGWKFYPPKEGYKLWINDEDVIAVYDGAAWITYSLNNLGDVTITTPAANEVLEFNGTAWVNTGRWPNGASTARPASPPVGYMYFDTDLGKPIWWNGTGWVDATGTAV